MDEIPRPSATDNQPPLPVKRKVMRMRKKKIGAPPPSSPTTSDTANRIISEPPPPPPPDAAPKTEEVEGIPNNRTADEKRCKLVATHDWFIRVTTTKFFFSPLAIHHRELQERPLHVWHGQQRHLLQLVGLQQARRHRLRLLRLRVRSVLPL